MEVDLTKVDEIVDRYRGEPGVLIQVLQDVQIQYNWLPREALLRVSQRLGVPFSLVYRIASFYKAFSLTPRGRHLVQVCLGTACHVRGGAKILERVEQTLGVEAGQTTPDLGFTLSRVNCLGCCALGPVMVVDDDYYGEITTATVSSILEKYTDLPRGEDEEDQRS